jgi:signal transduction histidine kinase
VRGHTLKDCGVIWLNAGIEAEIDSWLCVERSERRDNLMFQKGDARHFLGITISRVEFLSEGRTGFLITGTDVTERKQLEEQLRQAQKLEAIGQLAAGIAHEINTPAQYVGDNTQFLKESWPVVSELLGLCQTLGEESKAGAVSAGIVSRLANCAGQADLAYLLDETPRAIDQSLEGVQRVAKIVKAIKEFSHPGSEEKRAIDINRAIETTITVARNEWKYVADVVTHFDSDLPAVPCLAGEFNQVILNLLINAAQAVGDKVGDGSNGKGTITITTKREDEQAEIRIQDTGKGVPEAIRGRIFEPFFTTKPVGKGTGQGLAIAHTVIVKKHDGRIWFDSEVGKGTTFYVRLPLAPLAQTSSGG